MHYSDESESRYTKDFKILENTSEWFDSHTICTVISNLNTNNHFIKLKDRRGIMDEAIFMHLDSDEALSELKPEMIFFELESQRIYPFQNFQNKIHDNSFEIEELLPLCFYIGLKHKAFKIKNKNKKTNYSKLAKDFKTYEDLPPEFIAGIQSGEITIDTVEDDELKIEGFVNNIAKICQEIPNRPFTLLVLGHFKNHYASYIAQVSEENQCEIVSLNSLPGYNNELFTNALKQGIKKGLGLDDINFDPILSAVINQKDRALCGVVASAILGSVDHNQSLNEQFENLKSIMKGVINNKKAVRKLLARIAWWENAIASRKVFEDDQWKYVQHFTDAQAKEMKPIFSQLLYHVCKLDPPNRCNLPSDPALYEECQRFLNLFDIKVNDVQFLKLFNNVELNSTEITENSNHLEESNTPNAAIALDIDEISKNIESQKQQLQIALGLYCPDQIINKYNHPAPSIDTQQALIEKLKNDIEFLTNVLREFTYRGIAHLEPCDHAAETIKLLIAAGADPLIDHFSMNYESPGVDFVNGYAGQTALDNIRRSAYFHKSLEAFLNNFSILEKKHENSIETLLDNLFHIIIHINNSNRDVMINIIDELESRGFNLEHLDDKLAEALNHHFKNLIELGDDNPHKIMLTSAVKKLKLYITQRYDFIHRFKRFNEAYHDPNLGDEDCILLISDNNEIQKKQLQIALGIGINEEKPGLTSGRMVRGDQHKNTRLTLQAKLIEKISEKPNNKPFLSSVLREFILRPCDGGQIPCPNASETVKLLLNAGADPNVDHIDVDYDSPGRSFAHNDAGLTLIEIVQHWENAKTLSNWANTENDLILEAMRNVSNKDESRDEIKLCNLIHQVNYIKTLNHNKNTHVPFAEKIADSLLENYDDLESMTELFERVQEQYLQRELNDEKQKPNYIDAINSTKKYLQEKKLEKKFIQAYYSDATDEECIELISKNPDRLKKQLQIALGLETEQEEHLNQRLSLQKALIAELSKDVNNQPFFSNVLRHFIFYTCQGGKAPCKDADRTMLLLIQAGADSRIRHFDNTYQTEHKEQLEGYDGIPARYELERWAGNDSIAKQMLSISDQNSSTSISFNHYFRHLLNIISLSHDQNLSKARRVYLNQLAINTARNFVANGLKTDQLADLLNNTKDNNKSDTLEQEKSPELYRQAEGLLLEAIYQKEHKEEHRLLRMIKISLFFSPLILPLIFTGIVAIVRAVKLNNTTFTVRAEDISLEKFKEKFTKRDDFSDTPPEKVVKKIEQTYATQFPVKEDGATLRKAFVFNNNFAQPQWVNSHKKDAKLPSIFSGTSGISSREEGRLKNDVRVYRLNK